MAKETQYFNKELSIKGRLLFNHLVNKAAFKEGEAPVYSGALVLEDQAQIEKLKKAVEEVKNGAGIKTALTSTPLRFGSTGTDKDAKAENFGASLSYKTDGSNLPEEDPRYGKFFISIVNKVTEKRPQSIRPILADEDNNLTEDDFGTIFYDGAEVAFAFTLTNYDYMGKKGVTTMGISHAKKIADNDKFETSAPTKSIEDAFSDLV
jgi:hypothetical protein